MNNFLHNFYSKYTTAIRNSSPEKLFKILSALEHIEAIFEITAQKVFGERFKWIIIVLIQLTKFLIRICLLFIHKIGIQPSYQFFSISSFVNGKNGTENSSQNKNEKNQKSTNQNSSAFKLKHSNRVIRSIHNAPELNERNWIVNEPAQLKSDENFNSNNFDPTQKFQYLFAELLYITRPICHLTCLYFFTQNSWIQFIVPFLMDAFNLILINGRKNLSAEQQKEMKRRAYLFLNYFLRSPFYELCSKSILDASVNVCEQNIPCGKFIMKPIRNYIPQWRTIYSYCWSS